MGISFNAASREYFANNILQNSKIMVDLDFSSRTKETQKDSGITFHFLKKCLFLRRAIQISLRKKNRLAQTKEIEVVN